MSQKPRWTPQAKNKKGCEDLGITLTPAQSSAVTTRDKTLLVSAAAGSGKTATLARRIIDSLIDKDAPANISRMLIVTFTRASAADLREKISKELTKALLEATESKELSEEQSQALSQHLSKQLVELGNAHISTIDSFYYEIVKSNFQRIPLSQIPRIADSAEVAPINLAIMDKTIEDFYLEREGFERFTENFTGARNSDSLADVFIFIYEKLLSLQKGVDALKDYQTMLLEAAECDFLDTKFGEVAGNEALAFFNYLSGVTADMLELTKTDSDAIAKLAPAFSDDLSLWQSISGYIKGKNYEKIHEILKKPPYTRIGSYKGTDPEIAALKDKRDALKKKVKVMADKYFKYSQDILSQFFKSNAEMCGELHALLLKFHTALMEEKAARGICTFNDIRRFVLDILCDKNGKPTEVALEYRDRFDYIYIDEYQDVDDVQNTIFNTISTKTNRFMVGDIKQSIYSFRGADPSIFASYKKNLTPFKEKEDTGYSLFMSNNFRCDETVIDFSNAVSSFLFSSRAETIDYTKKDDLIFTKKYDDPDYVAPPVVVAITGVLPDDLPATSLSPTEKDELTKCGAKYVAQEIRRLVDTEQLASVKDDDGNLIPQSIEYKNIAILARDKKNFKLLETELAKLGIPSQSSVESNFFENPDVLLMLALLSTIDNPQKDISLAGTLRSPFYGFSLDDIVNIRSYCDNSYSLYDALLQYAENDSPLGKKCKKFNDELEYWRNAAMTSPCDKLIKKLYTELSILSYATNGSHNLLKLYEYAIRFESNGFKGLYGFIKYVNELIECKVSLSESNESGDENCVKIMTIHQSKGLEFPVCFVFQCEKGFNFQFKDESIQFEPSLGIGFTQHDETDLTKYDSPLLRSVIDTRVLLQTEEEMRLLYVAMTRARERLYMVANIPEPKKKLAKTAEILKYDKNYAILSSSSYIEWIMMALPLADKQNCFRIEYRAHDQSDISASYGATDANQNDDTTNAATADPKLVKLLLERFDSKYKFEHISKIPAKLSVSALSPKVLDIADEHVASLDQLNDSFEKQFGNSFTSPESLNAENGASAAERGTATHAFLQFCDFENAVKNGMDDEIARLREKKFISEKYADIINKYQLKAFFESELYKRISTAKRLWREQRFNIFLPASGFTQDEEKSKLLETETIAVQGVIDIFFEDADGKIVLCDYKTDYLTKEEISTPSLAADKLNERHAKQLSYYAKAIEEILGKTPDEVVIYSLPLKDSIKVEL